MIAIHQAVVVGWEYR